MIGDGGLASSGRRRAGGPAVDLRADDALKALAYGRTSTAQDESNALEARKELRAAATRNPSRSHPLESPDLLAPGRVDSGGGGRPAIVDTPDLADISNIPQISGEPAGAAEGNAKAARRRRLHFTGIVALGMLAVAMFLNVCARLTFFHNPGLEFLNPYLQSLPYWPALTPPVVTAVAVGVGGACLVVGILQLLMRISRRLAIALILSSLVTIVFSISWLIPFISIYS